MAIHNHDLGQVDQSAQTEGSSETKVPPISMSQLIRFIGWGSIIRYSLALLAVAGVVYEVKDYQQDPQDSLIGKLTRQWSDTFKDGNTSSSGIPNFGHSLPIENITPENTDKSLPELARALGYNIIKMEPGDTTGRTAFYDKGLYPGAGVALQDIPLTGKPGEFFRNTRSVSGSFRGFEEIPGSKNKYILLNDGEDKPLPKLEVFFENKLQTTKGPQATSIEIENLTYKDVREEPRLYRSSLGSITDWDLKVLEKILQPGDAVGIATSGGPVYHIKDGQVLEKVQEKPLVAFNITIRRAAGKAAIEEELGINRGSEIDGSYYKLHHLR